jgi:Domain of unknown function (DUF5658)
VLSHSALNEFPGSSRNSSASVTNAGRTSAFSGETGFGNLIIILFLVAQVLDAALTYLGLTIGLSEGNPLVAYSFRHAGVGPGLTIAKLVAVGCSMALHLLGLHRVLAMLTVMYLSLAILPWTYLLYFAH